MKYLVIDTEGTGLFDYKRPADAEGQPRLAHLGMIYLDESLAVEREVSYLVKPDGWVMSAEAQAVNGLSTDYLQSNGQPVSVALDAYVAAIEEGRAVVAYGAQHDMKQLRAELRRAGRPDLFDATPNVCIMRAMSGVCKLPQANGKGRKWPKLAEAMAHFHLPFEDAHQVMADAHGCLRLFRKGLEIGLRLEPSVHHAKEGTKAGEALKARGGVPEPGRVPELQLEPTPPKPAPLPSPRSAVALADQEIPE